jgi:hypothetical protein
MNSKEFAVQTGKPIKNHFQYFKWEMKKYWAFPQIFG